MIRMQVLLYEQVTVVLMSSLNSLLLALAFSRARYRLRLLL